jgi:polyhydroxybutyrate depolymerase
MSRSVRSIVRLVSAAAIFLTAACSKADSNDAKTENAATTAKPVTTTPTAPCKERTFGGDRPVRLQLPLVYDCLEGGPLLVVLHGYTGNGPGTIDYMGIKAAAETRGFLYLGPDGTKDGSGNQFWNASNACCNFAKSAVNDSAYLSKLIDDVSTEWNVDTKRVFLIGHSNGGFMAYRMACEHQTQIAAIASLAGAMPDDIKDCSGGNGGEEVSVLQIHGTDDETISFEGGSLLGNRYPSAKVSVLDWVASNGCSPAEVPATTKLDLVEDLPGDDTNQISFTGCKNTTEVGLWTINRGIHTPKLSASFASAVIGFFDAHPKN